MTYLLAALAGLAGAAAGWFIAAALGNAIAGAMGVTDFEGARGMAAVGGFGPIGAAAVVVRLQTLPMLGGGRSLPPQLVFEIRVPAALALPAAQHDLKIELQTDRNTADALLTGPWPPAAGDEPGTRLVAGLVELYFRTSRRMIVAKLPDGRSLLFAPKLRAAPAGSPDFGDWRALDWVDDADAKQPRRPRADEAFAIRYRVRWPGAD